MHTKHESIIRREFAKQAGIEEHHLTVVIDQDDELITVTDNLNDETWEFSIGSDDDNFVFENIETYDTITFPIPEDYK